jgi:hypothetical protein
MEFLPGYHPPQYGPHRTLTFFQTELGGKMLNAV